MKMLDPRLDACTDALDKLTRRLDALERDDAIDPAAKREFIEDAIQGLEHQIAAARRDIAAGRDVQNNHNAVRRDEGRIRDLRGQLRDLRADAEIRTDPPVSERQRRAMHAAAAGKSTLGIPRSVGAEFSEADPGGKLPEHRSDATKSMKIQGYTVELTGGGGRWGYRLYAPDGREVDAGMERFNEAEIAERAKKAIARDK